MDSKDLKEVLEIPRFKYIMSIVIIIMILLYFTQSYWIGFGVKLIYIEYNAEDVLQNNNVPDGVFILSGNYSYISEWINTTAYHCEENSNVKFLVLSIKDKYIPDLKRIGIMDVIEGCGK